MCEHYFKGHANVTMEMSNKSNLGQVKSGFPTIHAVLELFATHYSSDILLQLLQHVQPTYENGS